MHAIVWVALAVWTLGATSAFAARVSEVRVGTHEDGHTRIVVELDSPAGYRLQEPKAGQSPVLIVDLDASSIQRDVPSKSRVVKQVHVEPSNTGSTVRIALATGDVAVKEMLLSNPPRIVLDLKARGALPKDDEMVADAPAAEATKSEAEPVAVAPPAPVKVEPAKVDAPKPEAMKPEATKVEVAKPAAAPVVVANAEPAAKVADAAPVAHETPPPPPPAPVKIEPPSAPAAPEIKANAMPPAPTAPQVETTANAPSPPASKPVVIPPLDREKSGAMQSAEARHKALAEKTQPTPNSDSLMDLATSPIGYAVIGGVMLLLLAIVVMRRRRAAEDDDPLYTVMAADDAGAGVSMDAAFPAEQAASRPPVLASFGSNDPDAYEEASEPVFKPGAQGSRQLTLGHAPEPSEPTPSMLPDDDSESIFGGAPDVAPPPPSEPVAAPAAIPVATQAAGASADVERRITELERRLEQLTEARERLERQVAAQTEELRVQRAAIARTQRVVRGIAKTEDMATEPVPRAPNA